MSTRKPYTNFELVRHSLLPSATSLMASICFSILVIAAHLLLLSVADGTALPMIFDGEWSIDYTNTIVRPLDVLFNSPVFNSVLTVIVWGFLGLCVYLLVAMVVHIYNEARDAKRDVQVLGQRAALHPERREFLGGLVWRVLIFLITFVCFVAIQPVMRYLLAGDSKLVRGALGLPLSLRQLGFAFVGWVLLAHLFVVLLRLFLMRTRLFGENLY